MIDPTTITTLRRLLGEATEASRRYDQVIDSATRDLLAEERADDARAAAWAAYSAELHHHAPALLDAASEFAAMREDRDRWRDARDNAMAAGEILREECERLRAERVRYEPDSITAARELDRLRAEYQDAVNTRKAIAAAMSCEPADDADLVEAVRLLAQENHAMTVAVDFANDVTDGKNAERDAATARAERAEAALIECRDHLRVTCEQFDAIDPSKADVIATTERARVAEEIATRFAEEADRLNRLRVTMGDAAVAVQRESAFYEVAAYIRAAYCKEPTP